ncbi:hypothetical protein C5B42_00915 [Candidatus Cerribacteria bacterium 'Amazon FNV 2010 28 9']|uniref:Shikimate kinase n=1 Tax=Candidatus Cerribacteria bacterium 'Amazon FNV 2010 28 9' TaxID=2081795 RepID=A0A317JRC3_9BACT|nr:MAG: hypothetical protein C5B42_00915 [Candidatus Cerribacteria bacterium 'Amazon FNV 2010 28 9']
MHSLSVLLITRTCASGKTTLGELLEAKHGYKHIDGDVVWKKVKEENKRLGSQLKVGWNEIHFDILRDSLENIHSSNLVITHIIYPEVLPLYQGFFAERGMRMHFIVLTPHLQTIYERNNTRTCWSKPTPKQYVDEIYEKLHKDVYKEYFLDTSDQTPEQTVEGILERVK